MADQIERCVICGCTNSDCRQCIEKTGFPCTWVSENLCSACTTNVFWAGVTAHEHGLHRHHNPYMLLQETIQHAEDWEKGWDYAQRSEQEQE